MKERTHEHERKHSDIKPHTCKNNLFISLNHTIVPVTKKTLDILHVY